MVLDALKDAGLKPDDPAFQAALKFATRTQNLSETNDQPWAGNDGGFIYTPFNNGTSAAGEFQLGGKRMLRSYGSMTYAGLKSMIYAGLSHDDSRVKRHGSGSARISRWMKTPAWPPAARKTPRRVVLLLLHNGPRLSVYGQPIIVDAQGKKHDWRVEMIRKIATLQKPDGSFVGQRKWMEDNPILTTAYTVIALEEAKKDLKEHPAEK